MEQETQSSLLSLLPLLIMTIPIGFAARMLAKEKGRNVTRWTVLGFIPIVNYFCLFFFIGAANLRLEKKIDQLLERLNSGKPL
jgi:hypothetical protein